MIDRKLVLHVADLANLALSEDEVGFFQTQLSKILDHVAKLDGLTDDLGADWRGDTLGSPTPERPDVPLPKGDIVDGDGDTVAGVPRVGAFASPSDTDRREVADGYTLQQPQAAVLHRSG